jgi:hypothetical protein
VKPEGVGRPIAELLGCSFRLPLAWTAADAVVYAAAVGADLRTDRDYLDLSRGPRVLPAFLGARMFRAGQAADHVAPWAFELTDMVTLGCEISFTGDFPADADTLVEGTYVEIWDKGSSAIAVSEWEAVVASEVATTLRTSVMVRGRGNFGGERGPARNLPPDVDGAVECPVDLPANAAVLYQLVGDHNPHSFDPAFAAAFGFPGPISAGAMLIGTVARTLTHNFAGGDHSALAHISADYGSPHLVGHPLVLKARPDGSDGFGYALLDAEQSVLVHGRATLR